MTNKPCNNNKKKRQRSYIHYIHFFKGTTVHKHLARKSTIAKRVEESHFLELKM